MRRCAVRLRCLFATRTPSATACVESRNVPADPFRGQRMSPNCVWHSRYIAVSCSRNPLTPWTSGSKAPHTPNDLAQYKPSTRLPRKPATPRHPRRADYRVDILAAIDADTDVTTRFTELRG